jgi:hypothetical protein
MLLKLGGVGEISRRSNLNVMHSIIDQEFYGCDIDHVIIFCEINSNLHSR